MYYLWRRVPVCGDRLSIDQRVSVLSFEHAQLASQVFFVPSSFCHSCMGKITFWTSIWMQFPENIFRAEVLLQLFFWLWFYLLFLLVWFFLFIFPSEIHSVYTDNIMQKCRIPFIFSISGLFIYFHAFNFSYICFYRLSPIFFSVLWPDRSLDG